MAKVKIKFNAKDFLLRRGELLAMGAAGLCLVVLLGWGASKWTSAKDPNDIAKELANKSDQVKRTIAEGKASDADLAQVELPPFLKFPPVNKQAKTSDFATNNPPFDPTGTPNTKRENPIVYVIGDYQVDLTRSAMPGYDIIYDNNGEPLIAVLTTKTKSKLDAAKLKEAADAIKASGGKGRKPKSQQPPKNPQDMMPPGGAAAGPAGPGGIGGIGGGQFDANIQRDDKVIMYVPLKEIDQAVNAGNVPALTVIPVRLVTIHAVVPYKKQLEEIKRALRLTTDAEAKWWGPWYDGFEIQRREFRILPNGEKIFDVDWADQPKDPKSTAGNYRFEERYIEKIDTRKVGDHFDEGFLPYFLKPELMLSMPLPLLAKDLNIKYPEIRLKTILDNIKKLEDANKPKVSASELAIQLAGTKPRSDLYKPKTDNSGGVGVGGDLGGQRPPGPGGPGMPPVIPMPMGGPPMVGIGGGTPKPPDGINPYAGSGAPPTEVENFLLRFLDCDVKPGRTYEYRVRLRMANPNYLQDKLVANPEFAKETYKMLYSKWLQLDVSITVPAESFLYAYDTKAYREQTAKDYAAADQKELLNRLQIKDNQAVVQMATWMEQVRTDAGTKREPVGSWVVTEIPVGRAEYIGRKQYVKLPLWSSETQQYLLREVADKIVGGPKATKDLPQPKGWLVDFSTKSILVDFEGGKVKSKFNVGFDDKGNVVQKTRQFEEEVATELLIVRPDGKLVVRSSKSDDIDENRKDVASKWSEWLKLVEGRKSPTTGMGEPTGFEPKKN